MPLPRDLLVHCGPLIRRNGKGTKNKKETNFILIIPCLHPEISLTIGALQLGEKERVKKTERRGRD